MGAWGPGVFSDDVGCEVREQYRELLREGQEGPAATDTLFERFRDVLLDEDSEAVFYLALAVTQWRVGRLEDRVKARALAVIESGLALRNWEETASLARARKAELTKVSELLHSPQRTRTKLRKRFRSTCDWAAGELIGFRLPSGRYVIFRVVETFTDQGGTFPVLEILDWSGQDIPDVAALSNLPIHVQLQDNPPGLKPYLPSEISRYIIGEVSKRRIPEERLLRLHINLPPTQRAGGRAFLLWRSIDEFLEREFGYQ
ncbi:MAG: hypothetical protein B7X34_06450 [Acidobacteriia bacterium 12-62-4]|nr:MAG: hypothetical protein B7X34_06450 [Acidobacteriia bacterium 12-62-4]